MGANAEPLASAAPRCRVLHAWVSEDVYAVLAHEAARRRMHPDAFVAQSLIDIAAYLQAKQGG